PKPRFSCMRTPYPRFLNIRRPHTSKSTASTVKPGIPLLWQTAPLRLTEKISSLRVYSNLNEMTQSCGQLWEFCVQAYWVPWAHHKATDLFLRPARFYREASSQLSGSGGWRSKLHPPG